MQTYKYHNTQKIDEYTDRGRLQTGNKLYVVIPLQLALQTSEYPIGQILNRTRDIDIDRKIDTIIKIRER